MLFGTTKTGGQAPIVIFKGKIRLGNQPNAAWIETFKVKIDTAVESHILIPNPIGNNLEEMTDFRVEVTTDKDNTDVTARFWWYFIDNR